MKRKLDDTLPPAKKRKLDTSPSPKVESDPSVIIPKLKVSSVFNGVVAITFSNIDAYYEQEIATHSIYQFELLHRRNQDEWRSVKYFNHEVSCYEHVYLKVLVDIKDYELHFKLRAKLHSAGQSKWSEFSEPISIQIASSLIAHQFRVGEYVEFRDKDEYYSREGKIVQVLPDNFVRIRPFYNRWNALSNHNHNRNHNGPADDDDDDEDANGGEDEHESAEDEDEPIWPRYTALQGLYFAVGSDHEHEHEDEHDHDHDRESQVSELAADSGDNKMDADDDDGGDEGDEEDQPAFDVDVSEQALTRNVSMHDDEDAESAAEAEVDEFAIAEYIDHGHSNSNSNPRGRRHRRSISRRKKYVDVHCSRLYGDGIRLPSVVDITDNQRNVDKMMLLRTDNESIMNMYSALNEVYCDYAQKYVESINNSFYDLFDDQYQLQFIGRFISINVCDFLMETNRFKWKIACLRESNDGQMELNPVRCDIISARIEGLKDKISGMNLYDIDNIIGFCDICRLEISDYDWRYNCCQHITNKHDICLTCAYNVIHQYLQLNGLLYPLLQSQLNDDCIQEITNFVVGSVVKL